MPQRRKCMYSSSVLDDLLKEQEVAEAEVLKRKKTEKINQKIDRVSNMELINNSKLKFFSFLALSLFMFLGAVLLLVYNTTPFPIDPIGVFVLFISIFFSLATWFPYGTNKQALDALKELYVELSEKPYECRMEWVKGEQKVKVVVEANLVLDEGLVIKEKSQHLTAYLDMTQPGEKMCVMIATLIKKAEAQFGK